VRRKAVATSKAVSHFYRVTTRKEARPYGGRRAYAQKLAQAEAEASARGWRAEWEGDPDGDDEAFGVVLRDEHGHLLADEWGVSAATRPVRRLVEARLTLRAMRGDG
jgi:uncharacterized protein YndB with AHSA1/START domain